jgi:SnoaL-like domain
MWLPAFDELLTTAGVDPADVGATRIDDPQHGHIEGAAAAAAYRDASDAWLRERSGVVNAIATTSDEGRSVGEFGVDLSQDGRSFTLPVAVMFDTTAGPDRTWIRVYHSQWPLLGHHVRRSPLLERDPDVRESDVVGEYQAALAAGDAERILATFEPDGCFREPAGGAYRVCGTDALRELFTHFFGSGGGITLEHCTATEDGVRTALEFNAVRWGRTDMPHQAGIAVYERGRTGRIAEARIYDDVDPPLA